MTVRRQSGDNDTATKILDVAERLVQTKGFNAFSYADVAAEVAVSKPALHYHFAGKAELGEALITRYAARFDAALEHIDATAANPSHKLGAYADLYRQVLVEDRMCLCGMLAAEIDTLPSAMRDAVVAFFDHNETWLVDVLNQGQADGAFRILAPTREIARRIIGTLEGSMLVARAYRDPTRFTITANHLLAELASTSPAAP